MKNISLFFLFIFLPFISNCKQVLIKLSPTDCLNCIANLDLIIELAPNAKIVLENRFEADSIDIIGKFGITTHQKRIIWSDSLFQLFPHSPMSYIAIVSDNKIVWQQVLKNMHFPEFKSVLFNGLCNYKLPNQFDISSNSRGFILKNKINGNYFILENGGQKKVEMPNFVMETVYKNILKDTLNYDLYLKYQVLPNYRPKITNVFYDERKASYKCIINSYKLENVVNNHDSIFNFVISVMELKNDSVKNISVIDLQSVDPSYSFTAGTYFQHGGNLFAKIKYDGQSDQLDKLKFVARLKYEKGKGVYAADKLYDFSLPEHIVDQKIYYNMLQFYQSFNYITFQLTDKIYDVDSGEEIKLPFDTSYYLKNEHFMKDFQLRFVISDMKYSPAEKLFTVLYFVDDEMYATRFKTGAKNFKGQKIANHWNEVRAVCLSNDGKNVVLNRPTQPCLEFIPILE
jgi:hypothetical protein